MQPVPAGDHLAPRSRKTSELVAREIVRDIVEQRLQPGEMLPSEQAMLTRYGVGRPALREAVRVLEVHGLLRVKPGPGGGPVVGTVTGRAFGEMASLFFRLAGTTFRELIEARLELEPMAARVAAERRDPVRLASLRALIEREATVDLADDAAYARLARDFHAALVDASGNGVVGLMGSGLLELYEDRLRIPITPRDQRPAALAAHVEIVEAVERGDAERAEALTRASLAAVLRRLEELLPDLLDQVIDWA
jgi:GntR family transcriptional regulator, transcriptional repressor for pyruvate dehydrogenase complex